MSVGILLLFFLSIQTFYDCRYVQAWSLVDRFQGMNRVNTEYYNTISSGSKLFSSAQQRNNDSINNKNANKDIRRQEMLDFIDRPMQTTVGDNIMNDNDTLDLVHCIVKAADGRKADNIVALSVSHVSTLASYLVLLTGNSRPQNQAIAAAITKDVQEQFNGQRPGGSGVPEGTAESGWMLLDYGSVIVHIMTPKSRLFYNVEGQWKDKGGIPIDLSHILVPNNVPDSISPPVRDETDPFWS